MLKIESWRDLVGTNIQNVTELEFEDDYYKYISTIEGVDTTTDKYVVEKIFNVEKKESSFTFTLKMMLFTTSETALRLKKKC